MFLSDFQRDDEIQDSLRVKVLSSEPKKSNSKVLLTIPNLGKKDSEEEDLYVTIQPRKAGQPTKSMGTHSSSISPRIPRRPVQVNTFGSIHHPISYGDFKIELHSLIKSLGIVSNDEKIKTVYHVESSFFGTILTVPPQVQSLSLRLNLTSIPEHTMYSTGFLYTSKMDILKFKMSKSGVFQDTQLNLRDGPNLFEIRIVGGIVDESDVGKSRSYLEFVPGTEKGQTFLLIVNRF